MYNNIQKNYPRFLFFAKLVILAFAYRLVSQRIFEEGSYSYFLERLSNLSSWGPLVVLVLLSFTGLNWILEIRKWQKLADVIRPTSFGSALRQSLSSLTVSLVTPNRIGEYGAKAIYFPRKERSRVILFNFIGNFNQMATTVIFGSLGLLWVFDSLPQPLLQNVSWGKILIAALTVFAGLVLLSKMWKGFYSRLVSDLRSVPLKLHLHVFLLSLLKYLVFSHQFYFLLVLFGAELGYFEIMSLLSLSYLISSLIPGFVLFDWLVKGSVAVAIFGQFGVNEIAVLSITSVMWLLNFGLPSVIGTVYVMAFRLNDSKSLNDAITHGKSTAEK